MRNRAQQSTEHAFPSYPQRSFTHYGAHTEIEVASSDATVVTRPEPSTPTPFEYTAVWGADSTSVQSAGSSGDVSHSHSSLSPSPSRVSAASVKPRHESELKSNDCVKPPSTRTHVPDAHDQTRTFRSAAPDKRNWSLRCPKQPTKSGLIVLLLLFSLHRALLHRAGSSGDRATLQGATSQLGLMSPCPTRGECQGDREQ